MSVDGAVEVEAPAVDGAFTAALDVHSTSVAVLVVLLGGSTSKYTEEFFYDNRKSIRRRRRFLIFFCQNPQISNLQPA